MKLKLKCGDIYNTEIHPSLQNLSRTGINEVMEMIKNDTNMVTNHNY